VEVRNKKPTKARTSMILIIVERFIISLYFFYIFVAILTLEMMPHNGPTRFNQLHKAGYINEKPGAAGKQNIIPSAFNL